MNNPDREGGDTEIRLEGPSHRKFREEGGAGSSGKDGGGSRSGSRSRRKLEVGYQQQIRPKEGSHTLLRSCLPGWLQL